MMGAELVPTRRRVGPDENRLAPGQHLANYRPASVGYKSRCHSSVIRLQLLTLHRSKVKVVQNYKREEGEQEKGEGAYHHLEGE